MKKFIFLIIFFAGCAAQSPPLSPLTESPTSSNSETIQVVVKPVVTKGFGSEDEKKWGIDLSAYFTAFEVRVINHTSKDIFFSPFRARLVTEKEQVFLPLTEKESIHYYKNGNGEPIITLFPKSEQRAAEEIEKIKEAHLPETDISPGNAKEGLLFFKKIGSEGCQKVVLELNEITVVESREVKNFSFPFACDKKGS